MRIRAIMAWSLSLLSRRAKPPCRRRWKSHQLQLITAPRICPTASTLLRCQLPATISRLTLLRTGGRPAPFPPPTMEKIPTLATTALANSHAGNKIPFEHSSPGLPSAANDIASQAAQDRGPPGAALAADHGKDSNSGHDGVGDSHAANKIHPDHSSPALPSAANDIASQAAQDRGPPGAALVADHGKDSNSGQPTAFGEIPKTLR